MTRRSTTLHRPDGFTLVELSILLVIVALMIGGTVVGRDLVEAAKIRSLAKQVESFNAAASAFKLKYEAIPGDAARGAQFGFSFRWGGSPGLGNGDGLLQSRFQPASDSATTYGDELVLFWNDLTRAALIDQGLDAGVSYLNWSCGSVATDRARCYPRAAIGGGDAFVTIYNKAGQHHFLLTNYPGFFNSVYPFPVLTPEQAYAWDAKSDDGMPLDGRITALAVAVGATPVTPAANACAASGTAYNFATGYASQQLCAVGVRANF